MRLISGTQWTFCENILAKKNNISLSLENPCTLLLEKEKTWKHIFNTNSELSQNLTEKQNYAFQNNSKLAI